MHFTVVIAFKEECLSTCPKNIYNRFIRGGNGGEVKLCKGLLLIARLVVLVLKELNYKSPLEQTCRG